MHESKAGPFLYSIFDSKTQKHGIYPSEQHLFPDCGSMGQSMHESDLAGYICILYDWRYFFWQSISMAPCLNMQFLHPTSAAHFTKLCSFIYKLKNSIIMLCQIRCLRLILYLRAKMQHMSSYLCLSEMGLWMHVGVDEA